MDSANLEEFKGWSRLALWEKYQEVAMHFNDLLLKLRTSALAVVAALSTIVGLFTRSDGSLTISWEIASAIVIGLIFFWIAIWVLDFRYYNRLLLGAATALIELESKSEEEFVRDIKLSTRITDAVSGTHQFSRAPLNYGGAIFYFIVLCVLTVGLVYTLAHTDVHDWFIETTLSV